MNYFTPKLMKIRWSYLFLGGFVHHFQIKLSTYGSNLNSIFVIISELEFFLLTGVLTQNFNIVDLVKFLEKIQKLEKPKFYGQNKLFLAPCPSILWQF
jgi:hypothetical protein